MRTKIKAEKGKKPTTPVDQSPTEKGNNGTNQFLKTLLLIIVTAVIIPSGAFLVHFAWRANSVFAEMKEVKVEIAEAIAAHSHRAEIKDVENEIDVVTAEVRAADKKFTRILVALELSQRDIKYMKEKIDGYIASNADARAAIILRLDKFEYQRVPAIVRDMGVIKDRMYQVEKEIDK